jgi:hypothetical protein
MSPKNCTEFRSYRYSGSGSFIRYSPKHFQIGTTLPLALKDKYLPSNAKALQLEYDPEKDIGHVQFGGNKSITVETVGFEKIERKQSNIEHLRVAGLKSMQISSPGSDQEIANTCPSE